MKTKLLTTLAMIGTTAVFAQQSIPNGSFETWNSTSILYPKNYPATSNTERWGADIPENTQRSTDAFHGNYAIELTTINFFGDTAFGYFVNAQPDGDPNQWHGGLPISETPTGIRGHYKSDIEVGDSAFMLAVFSKNGANIGSYFFYIKGTQSTYAPFNFTFNPPLSQTPDSMIFGAVSSDAFNEFGLVGSMLLLDSISLTGITTQPAWFNGDFENWDSIALESPVSWYQELDRTTYTSKTTTSHKGMYAVKLETKLDEKENGDLQAESEQIGTGYYQDNCWSCDELGGYPYTNQVDTLVFWYKYVSNGDAQATVRTKIRKDGMTVGGSELFLLASASYQKIEIALEAGLAPDTLQLFFQSSRWEDSLLTNVGSTLFIDEIQLKSAPLNTGIKTSWFSNKIKFYPNPATDMVYINIPGKTTQDYATIKLVNILGQVVFEQKLSGNDNAITIANLHEGVYFYTIELNGTAAKSGRLIKE
jgi:hypothetical protein